MAEPIPFNVEAARADGVTEAEIAAFLAPRAGFDLATARKDGVDDSAIVAFLTPPPPEPKAPSKKAVIADDFNRGWQRAVEGIQTIRADMSAAQLAEIEKAKEAADAGEYLTPWQKKQVADYERTAGAARAETAGLLSSAAGRRKKAEELPIGPGYKAFKEAEGWKGKLAALWDSPGDVVTSILAEGAVAMAPAIGAAMIGGVGPGAVVGGLTPFAQTYAGKIVELLGKQGVDINDKNAVMAALADPAVARSIRNDASLAALPQAAAGAAAMAVAPITMAPAGLINRPIAQQAVNIPAQAGVQGALAGAGQAGERAILGEPLDSGEIMEAAIGGATQGPADVAAFAARRAYLRAKPDPAKIMETKSVDEAIEVAQAVVEAPPTPVDVDVLAVQAREFGGRAEQQEAQLLQLFGGMNEGSVERAGDGTYHYRVNKGETEYTIPLKVWDEKAPAVGGEATIPPALAAAQREHYGKLGIDVVYFDDPGQRIGFDGAVDPQNPNTVHLSNNPERNAAQVGAHEVTHVLESTVMPDGTRLGDLLHEQVMAGMTAEGQRHAYETFGKTAPDRVAFPAGPEGDSAHADAVVSHLVRELGADIGGEAPRFQTFIPKVVDAVEARYGIEAAKDVLQKLIAGIRRAMTTMREFFYRPEEMAEYGQPDTVSQRWVSNLDDVHDTLARMHAERFGTQAEKESATLRAMQKRAQKARAAENRPAIPAAPVEAPPVVPVKVAEPPSPAPPAEPVRPAEVPPPVAAPVEVPPPVAAPTQVQIEQAALQAIKAKARPPVAEQVPEAAAPPLAPEAVRAPEAEGHADHRFAERVVRHIAETDTRADGKMSPAELQKLAEREYGGTLANGAYSRDRFYDAIELGVNRFIQDNPGRFNPAVDAARAMQTAADLAALKDKLPTQTVRAGEKDAYQQFSTPPDYAYAASWVANLKPGDHVLEPSAGVGGLIVHAMNAGVRETTVNELSEKRRGMIGALKPTRTHGEDAAQLHNILSADVRPTVVVMNPPFSRSAERMGSKMVLDEGAKHIEQALARLEPGGRLVAIVGDGMKPEGTVTEGYSRDRGAGGGRAFRDWWAKIGAQYDVRANIGVDRSIYSKYGTSFPTRFLVIDKIPPSGREMVTGQVRDAAGLIDRLQEVRNDRSTLEQLGGQPSRPAVAAEGERGAGPDRELLGTTGALGTGERDQGRQADRAEPAGPAQSGERGGPTPVVGPEASGTREPVVPVQPEHVVRGAGAESGDAVARGDEPAASRPDSDRDGIRPDGSGERVEPGVTPAPEIVRATEESIATPGTDHPLTEAIYETYKPSRVRIEGAKAHPGALVQSAAMASILPPKTDYKPRLPAALIKGGALSDAQLEAITYAGHAHGDVMPNGRRRGFFIGDGTGVGKGREIAGILLDNWQNGRTKAVWVSEKRALINDAKRDWNGLGQPASHILDHGKMKPGEPIKSNKGILFTSYDTMKMAEQAKADGEKIRGKERVDQIVEWLGKDFDGVIAFDEAHNLGNATDSKGGRGVKKASLKALAGVSLQDKLPNARVVYVSATGATEINNLAFADRLGLWGEGTAFPNREAFVAKVTEGGVAGMELVARDMKGLGHYIARNLSYDGVEYDRVEHKLTPDQRTTYDKLAEGWQSVLQNFEAAMAETGVTSDTGKALDGKRKSAILSAFWGGHQRFFNQIITSMQMPSVIRGVEADLKAGRQAVLQLVNTMESAQDRAVEKKRAAGEDLEDLDMTPRDQLMELVRKSYPVQQFEEYIDEKGNLRSRPVVDSKGDPVVNKTAVAARERLLDELGSLRVPDGPLEMLFNHFGTDKVAEVTGRGQRVVRAPDDSGQMKTILEKRGAQSNVADTEAFQDGKKPILVFSQAGGTGRSYHAAIGSGSEKARRSHYLVQGGWRADAAVQGFGRTHRTSQASAPIFHLVTTDLQGQKRFIASIARRLAQLGALTKGERRTGDQGMFGMRDNLESDEARSGLIQFFKDVAAGEVEGVTMQDLEKGMGLKLRDPETGGLAADLPPMPQFLNRVLSLTFDHQNRVFDAFSERMNDAIDRAAAAGTLDTGTETYKADRISKQSEQTVYTDPRSGAETKHVHLLTETRNKPIGFEETLAGKNKTNGNKPDAFVQSEKSGKVFAVTRAGDKTDSNGRVTAQARLTDANDYQMIDRDRLSGDNWKKLTPEQARPLWDAQVAATPEYRKSDLHLITGAVLPIWDRLGGNPKIFRLQTADGERMLGRVIPATSVSATLQRLGAEGLKVAESPGEIAERVLGGATATLANEWKIKSSRVAGERRLELIGPDYTHGGELGRHGIFSERIAYQTRYFIPTDPAAAAKAIEAITKTRPVTSLADAAEGARFSPKQTETPEFRRFFQDSKVVDEEGQPAVMYHGTERNLEGGAFKAPAFFTPDAEATSFYSLDRTLSDSGGQTYPVYLSIKNPLDSTTKDGSMAFIELAKRAGVKIEVEDGRYGWTFKSEELEKANGNDLNLNDLMYLPKVREQMAKEGYDGLKAFDVMTNYEIPIWVPLEPTQIKSAIGNTGAFDPANPDIRYSPKLTGENPNRQYTPEQRQAFENVGRVVEPVSLRDRIAELRQGAATKIIRGIADSYSGIKASDPSGYMAARMANSAAGAQEVFALHGTLKFDGKTYNWKERNGGVQKLIHDLGEEAHDFIWWVAANRAERLAAEDRENLFSPDDIAANKTLNQGTMEIGRQLSDGTLTRNREAFYLDALKRYDAFNRNALDLLVESGHLSRKGADELAKYVFYVPFYREAEEGGTRAFSGSSNGLAKQKAFERLKGGTEKLRNDLWMNAVGNWEHIIDAAIRNKAAVEILNTAEGLGAARRIKPGVLEHMTKAERAETTWVMEDGQRQTYHVSDPGTLAAVAALDYVGSRGPLMTVGRLAARGLRYGVTANPVYAARNLTRDTQNSLAVSRISPNIFRNLADGFRALDMGDRLDNLGRAFAHRELKAEGLSDTALSALAGGALMRMGAASDTGIDRTDLRHILDSPNKAKAFLRYLGGNAKAYKDMLGAGEDVTRIALYKQMREAGEAHDFAAFSARDLQDFTLRGAWAPVRTLLEITPFLPSRIQGLYKIGRVAAEADQSIGVAVGAKVAKGVAIRLGMMFGAMTLAGLALDAIYEDDPEYRKRTEFDRQTYYWFRIGEAQFRVPKGFELAALSSLAVDGIEAFLGVGEMTGRRLVDNFWRSMRSNLEVQAPALIQPLLDLHGNERATGGPIETLGQKRLVPEERYNAETTLIARSVSSGLNRGLRGGMPSAEGLSPVELDYLVNAYGGWLATNILGMADMAVRAVSSEPVQPAKNFWAAATQGLVRTDEAPQSRYVDMLYTQGKQIEQAYATYRDLLQRGRGDEARQFLERNRDDIVKHGAVAGVMRLETDLGRQIRMIANSTDPDMTAERKKIQIMRLTAMKNRAAQSVFAPEASP